MMSFTTLHGLAHFLCYPIAAAIKKKSKISTSEVFRTLAKRSISTSARDKTMGDAQGPAAGMWST